MYNDFECAIDDLAMVLESLRYDKTDILSLSNIIIINKLMKDLGIKLKKGVIDGDSIRYVNEEDRG